MSFSFGAGVRDSLSNLAASLGAGKDKAAHDAFTVFDLGRSQIESMYRGDWLARKVVDIVPYPNAAAVFAEAGSAALAGGPVVDYAPSQPRDPDGRWTALGHDFELSGASPVFAEAVKKAAGTAGAEAGATEKIAATTKNFRHACKRLKLEENDASDALHAAKYAHGLSASDTCMFDTDTGDIIYDGEIIGNLGD